MRKRVLFSIMVLALVAGMALTVAVPGLAAPSAIEATKETEPALPNIYYVGDTIDYVMTVKNPEGNPATNTITRIWDTLPDGTVIEFLYEGSPYGNADNGKKLIQSPGDVATFTASYTVDADDITWLPAIPPNGAYGVTNKFEAEGFDSLGDNVYALVARNSRVIRPDTATTIDASATTVPSGDSVDLTITEANTGDVDLTNPYVEVWRDGALFATLTAPPDSGDVADPGVLNAEELWSWTIDSGAITAPTTFVALGFGTDPLGNVISYATGHEGERGEVRVAPEPVVGGEAYPANKLPILALGGALLVAVIAGASLVALRRRRA